MTTVDEARRALESYVHQLAPTKTLTGEQHQALMRLTDALIAAVRAETDAVIADYARRLNVTDDARQTALDYIAQQQDAEAKLAALREALERIVVLPPKGPFHVVTDELAEAQSIARAALAATPAERGSMSRFVSEGITEADR